MEKGPKATPSFDEQRCLKLETWWSLEVEVLTNQILVLHPVILRVFTRSKQILDQLCALTQKHIENPEKKLPDKFEATYREANYNQARMRANYMNIKNLVSSATGIANKIDTKRKSPAVVENIELIKRRVTAARLMSTSIDARTFFAMRFLQSLRNPKLEALKREYGDMTTIGSPMVVPMKRPRPTSPAGPSAASAASTAPAGPSAASAASTAPAGTNPVTSTGGSLGESPASLLNNIHKISLVGPQTKRTKPS